MKRFYTVITILDGDPDSVWLHHVTEEDKRLAEYAAMDAVESAARQDLDDAEFELAAEQIMNKLTIVATFPGHLQAL